MHHENRVIWGEGMFLRPQHFQQADRWTERMMQLVLHMTPGHWRGIATMEIDTGALARGEFALLALRAGMPDGTMFEVPVDAALPAPILLEETAENQSIYLTLARRDALGRDIRHNDVSAAKTDRQFRLTTREIDLPDANSDISQGAQIEVGQFDLQLICAQNAQDNRLRGRTILEIARIREVTPDKSVSLDNHFIPPCLNCGASPKLVSFMKELSGLIAQRAQALAERTGTPAQLSLDEMADFLLLSALNRAEPLLQNMLEHAAHTHPDTFFKFCLALSGDLAAFCNANKRPSSLTIYCHDDLSRCFSAIMTGLRSNLATMPEKRTFAINLVKKQFGLYVGIINDPVLLDNADCILAVQSTLSEKELRHRIPSQIKIGPIETIAKLVKVAIPGIGLHLLPVVPHQLPFQESAVYFELDRNAPLWSELQQSKAIALHLAAPFPELQMQMWVLKR